MRIAIFGLGYVGMTAAACLSSQGHEIVGVDVSEDKVSVVNAGRSPICEPGVDKLIADAVNSNRMMATTDAAPHLNDCSMAIVCVGTPSAPDGSHNMGYIAEVTRQISTTVRPDRTTPLTVVYRSTVRPGTMEELVWPIFEQSLADGVDVIELVYNPEFLRESTAVDDFFNPPKIVIGTREGAPSVNMDKVNEGISAPVFYTRFREAEVTKFVDNSFHALKITFANEIGRVCGRLGINARKVHEIFVSDTKLNVSPYYLRPGGAFGGSCLPKDVRAFQYIAADAGAHTHMLDSLIRSNEAHKHYLFEMAVNGLKPASGILQLGLAFKAHSDDLRESPNIDIARKLLQAGHNVSILDPNVEPARLLGQNLGYAFSNLPTLRKLLISQQEAESTSYDLVVDTRGWAKKLSLNAGRIVDVNTLS